GGKLLLNPHAKCWYYARDNLRDFFGWGFIGGATPVTISRLTGRNLCSLRNFIPPVFFFSLFTCLLLGAVAWPFLIPFGIGSAAYLGAALVFATKSSLQRKVPSL